MNNITLYDPKEIHTKRDLQNYKRGLSTSKVFKQLRLNIQNQEAVGKEIVNERSLENIKDTKSYIDGQFQKNMIRKSALIR